MPALKPAPQILRVQLKFTLGSDLDVLPRSYWQYGGSAPTNAQLTTMAGSLFTYLQGAWPGLFAPTTTFTEIEITDLTSDTAATGLHAGSIAGTRTGGLLPASTAANVHFGINRRYRGGKPRIELPFGTDTDLLTPQTWTSAFITAVDNAWTSFGQGVSGEGWTGGGPFTQFSVSYYGPPNRTITSSTGRVRTASTARDVPILDQVIGFQCQTRPGSVRKRLGKAA